MGHHAVVNIKITGGGVTADQKAKRIKKSDRPDPAVAQIVHLHGGHNCFIEDLHLNVWHQRIMAGFCFDNVGNPQ